MILVYKLILLKKVLTLEYSNTNVNVLLDSKKIYHFHLNANL